MAKRKVRGDVISLIIILRKISVELEISCLQSYISEQALI